MGKKGDKLPQILSSITFQAVSGLVFFIHNYSVGDPDPGLGAFLTPGSGMGESQHPDTGSGMNNPDHIL